MRILTWNLFHGRAIPPAGRSLRDEFGGMLASWEWDVALLQEVPPWWPPELGRVCDASAHTALTSRNALLPLRRAIADRRPDLIKSNGGSANAILVRAGWVSEHRVARLRRWPERRVVHAVRLEDGTIVGNLHAQVHSPERAHADAARAGAFVLRWAEGGPAILGGDFNVPTPTVDSFEWMGGHGVDHVLARGFTAHGPGTRPARGALSDHEPVLVELSAEAG
jgi:endonuclease/exonuclease/phosphatase family metal-dependent hydrolase